MKAAFLSLAAVFCMVTAASAQNEVPEAGNNNATPVDQNVYAPTRMEMQSGSQTVRDGGVEAVEPGTPTAPQTGATPSAADGIGTKNSQSVAPYGDSRTNPGQSAPVNGTKGSAGSGRRTSGKAR